MRYVEFLYKQFNDFNDLFEFINYECDDDFIEMCKNECKHPIDSFKFYDYLINRLHLLQKINMFEICPIIEYKGYKCSYWTEDMKYIGIIIGTKEKVSGNNINDLLPDFYNTVDYVLNLSKN